MKRKKTKRARVKRAHKRVLKPKWTENEIEYLRCNFCEVRQVANLCKGLQAVRRVFGASPHLRTEMSVWNKARNLGLTRREAQ